MRSLRLLAVAVLAVLLSLSCGPIQEANALLRFNPSADTYLDISDPNPHGSGISLLVEGGGAVLQRTLLKFDLSSIPIGSTVTEATLRLYVHGYGAVAGTVTVYRATEEWAEDQATWNVRLTGLGWAGISPPGAGGTWATDGAATAAALSGGWMSWTVTDIVKAWIEGAQNNYGFVIKVTDEGTNCWLFFASGEYYSKEYYPVLEVLGPPEPSVAPVGGFVESANKLAVFAPYLALLGLVAAVAVVATKPWKKTES
jgi:hypothetical protein